MNQSHCSTCTPRAVPIHLGSAPPAPPQQRRSFPLLGATLAAGFTYLLWFRPEDRKSYREAGVLGGLFAGLILWDMLRDYDRLTL